MEQSLREQELGSCQRTRATPMAFTGPRCRPVENGGAGLSPLQGPLVHAGPGSAGCTGDVGKAEAGGPEPLAAGPRPVGGARGTPVCVVHVTKGGTDPGHSYLHGNRRVNTVIEKVSSGAPAGSIWAPLLPPCVPGRGRSASLCSAGGGL